MLRRLVKYRYIQAELPFSPPDNCVCRSTNKQVAHIVCVCSVSVVFCLSATLFLFKLNFRRKTIIKELQVNGQIRDREIRLIGSDGQQLGIMSSYDAQRIADEQGLDLVKISPNAQPPVCKVMDYSKYKYEQKKKEKQNKQTVMEVKEVRLSMTIDVGDLNTKANIARKFLKAGDKVLATIRMRGRQQAYANQGVEVMKKFAEILADVSKIDKQPTTEGRNISMTLLPLK